MTPPIVAAVCAQNNAPGGIHPWIPKVSDNTTFANETGAYDLVANLGTREGGVR
jgi:hypothetical protein